MPIIPILHQRAPSGISSACSGGGDSVALLLLLWTLRKSLGLDLSVAHADHGLRPESAEDADFVRQLCRALAEETTLQGGIGGLAALLPASGESDTN